MVQLRVASLVSTMLVSSGLLLGCRGSEQTPAEAEPSLVPGATEATDPRPPLPTSAPSPVLQEAGSFDVVVVVFRRNETPSDEDIERVFGVATEWMKRLSGQQMVLRAIVPADTGTQAKQVAMHYLKGLKQPPDGILVINDDQTATNLGGWSETVSAFDAGAGPYVAEFRRTIGLVPRDAIYITAMDFDHLYAACGYDASRTRIVREVSMDGECRNRAGTDCVLVKEGVSVCSDSGDDLYAQPDMFAAAIIVHEFLHPFGTVGNYDHWGMETCTTRTGMTQAQADDQALFQQAAGMCPDVPKNFRPAP